MRTATIPPLLVAVALGSLSGAARAAGSAPRPPSLTRPASACVALFGADAEHEANRTRRATLIHWLASDGDAVTLAHASDSWAAPTRLRLEGLQLTGTSSGQPIVTVTAELAARLRCRAGRYAIGRDMSLGGAAVIAVLAEGLLLERHGRLRFLTRAGARAPLWQMIWGSPYEVAVSADPAPHHSRYAQIVF